MTIWYRTTLCKCGQKIRQGFRCCQQKWLLHKKVETFWKMFISFLTKHIIIFLSLNLKKNNFSTPDGVLVPMSLYRAQVWLLDSRYEFWFLVWPLVLGMTFGSNFWFFVWLLVFCLIFGFWYDFWFLVWLLVVGTIFGSCSFFRKHCFSFLGSFCVYIPV